MGHIWWLMLINGQDVKSAVFPEGLSRQRAEWTTMKSMLFLCMRSVLIWLYTFYTDLKELFIFSHQFQFTLFDLMWLGNLLNQLYNVFFGENLWSLWLQAIM